MRLVGRASSLPVEAGAMNVTSGWKPGRGAGSLAHYRSVIVRIAVSELDFQGMICLKISIHFPRLERDSSELLV
jgi:hypothetical protein